ncbi:hypothetical protein K7X08_033685 [Anisodus acutangulus]|uniref:Uncharacterized protein n=1 Tax=Anisodus acutangulus TaxID=402998 RepID=A0A9Q1RCU4_9SOLA|nr:hypothetical protein K7X08_033685 [Anisodus acutangulus]
MVWCTILVKWMSPPPNIYKLNTNGAFDIYLPSIVGWVDLSDMSIRVGLQVVHHTFREANPVADRLTNYAKFYISHNLSKDDTVY